MTTEHIPMFAQVNQYFDKAATHLDLPPGLLSQIKACNSVYRMLYVPLGAGKTWKLHAGARYFYGGNATYLKEGDIQDNDDGSVTLFPRHSKTDQVTWQAGVSYTFPLHMRRRGR